MHKWTFAWTLALCYLDSLGYITNTYRRWACEHSTYLPTYINKRRVCIPYIDKILNYANVYVTIYASGFE